MYWYPFISFPKFHFEFGSCLSVRKISGTIGLWLVCVNDPFVHGYPAERGQVELLGERLTDLSRFKRARTCNTLSKAKHVGLCPALCRHQIELGRSPRS